MSNYDNDNSQSAQPRSTEFGSGSLGLDAQNFSSDANARSSRDSSGLDSEIRHPGSGAAPSDYGANLPYLGKPINAGLDQGGQGQSYNTVGGQNYTTSGQTGSRTDEGNYTDSSRLQGSNTTPSFGGDQLSGQDSDLDRGRAQRQREQSSVSSADPSYRDNSNQSSAHSNLLAGAAGLGAGGVAGGLATNELERHRAQGATQSGNYDSSSKDSSNLGNTGYGDSSSGRDYQAAANDAKNQAQDKAHGLAKEHTDEQGFTDLTGGKGTDNSVFTGRVKGLASQEGGVDVQGKNDIAIETNLERSKVDSQGRELDSYGKPYTL